MNINIYCLYDPVSCKIRYIGRTRKPLHIRLIEHITKSRYYNKYFPGKNPPYKVNWINSLLQKGIEPKIKKLTEIKGWKESHLFEKMLIDKYKTKLNLVNLQDRGQGSNSKIVSVFTKELISKTLKEKYKNNEIRKKVVPIYTFDKLGNFIKKYESITLAAEDLQVSKKVIISKIKTGKSINKIFVSKTSNLCLENHLYIYNYISKQVMLFDTKLEILDFLKISDFIYTGLNKTKKIKNEWIVNSKNPNLEKQNIVLYKDGNVYSFDCVKSAAAHIGCVIYAVYDLLKGRTNSVYGYKTK